VARQQESRAIMFKHEVLSVLEQAGFELRKWTSNDPSIINSNNIYISVSDKGAAGVGNDARDFDCAITKNTTIILGTEPRILRDIK